MSLSDYRHDIDLGEKDFWVYPEEKVKEAVKELKRELQKNLVPTLTINLIIDKIFGDKLI